jgi:O-antigen ligase
LLLVGVLFVLLANRQIRLVRLVAFTGLPLLAVTIGAALMLRNFGSTMELGRYVADFATFATDGHGAGDLRWHIRLLGLFPEAIRTSPAIGIGTNNAGYEFYELMPIAGPQVSVTHNTYLDLLMETGGIGAVSFLLAFGAALGSAWKSFRKLGPSREGGLSLGIALGMLGMAFHFTNWSGWREAHIWFSIGLAVAASQTISACRSVKECLSRAESHHGG